MNADLRGFVQISRIYNLFVILSSEPVKSKQG